MSKETLTTIVSTVLTAIGASTTTAVYTTSDDVTAIVSGLVGLVGLVFAGISVAQRVSAKKAE